MAAHEGESQVAVPLAVDNVGCAHQRSLNVHATCRVAVVVAGIVHQSRLQVQHIAATCLILANKPRLTVKSVQRSLVLILIELHIAGGNVVVAEARCPVQVACNAALHARHQAELVTAHPVECRSLPLGKAYAIGKEGRSITVVAIEIELLGTEIGTVEEELPIRNQRLEVAVATQLRRAARVGRSLHVHLVVVRRIP